jgi:hypothetical protein
MSCQPWPISWSCDTETFAPELVELAEAAAVELLWALGGRRIGVCDYSESYRPRAASKCGPVPYISDGAWYNGLVSSGLCCRLLLEHRPVQSIIEVTEEGQVLDPAAYTLEANGWLRRRDHCWAAALHCDDPTVTVTYTAGVDFPASTAMAVGEVACEFLRGFSNQACKLPARAVSVARQGVTIQMGDPAAFIATGKLGLPIADAWLTVVNPHALTQRSKVYSPDLPMGV